MTVTTLLWVVLGAAAVLALWTIVRFPQLTPRSLTMALAVFVASQVLMAVGPVLVAKAATLPYGLYVGVLGVILPIFVFVFAAVGWLMLVVASIIGGPRGGHRIRLPGFNRS